jgi:amino acid permease
MEASGAAYETKWIIAACLVAVMAPLTWVQKIEKFKIWLFVGDIMILAVVVIISVFCFAELQDRGWTMP